MPDVGYVFADIANVESIKRLYEEAEELKGGREKQARYREKSALAQAKEPSAEATALSTSRTLQETQNGIMYVSIRGVN